MSGTAKAYQVTEDSEGRATVVFAKHAVVARRNGAAELDDEFEGVSCKRAPEFDRFAELGYVPPLDCIRAGWWWECATCGRRLSDDTDDDVSIETIVGTKTQVFCDQDCKDADDARIALKERNAAEFEQRVRKMRPDLQWIEFHGTHPDYTSWASFRFDGCQFPGSVREEKGITTWSVCNCDLAAWQQYETTRKGASHEALSAV